MPANLFTFLALVLFLCNPGHSENIFTTTAGLTVPLHLLQHHFSHPLHDSNLEHNVVYELSTENVIKGHGVSLDLNQDLRLVKRSRSSPTFTVTLNGHEMRDTTLDIVTLHGKGYTALLEAGSRKLLAVYGRGLHLRPLHATQYPNLLVNIKAFSSREMDMSGDYEIPPTREPEDESENTGKVTYEFSPEQEDVEVANRVSLNNVSTRQATCAGGTTHVVELAVAYDNTLCANFGNSQSAATAALQSTITQANVAFGANTCVQLVITSVEAHCNDADDPYATFSDFSSLPCTQAQIDNREPCSPGALILNRFTTFWRGNRNSVVRDAAVFFSGFEDGTSVAGRAFVGAACRNAFGYGWIEGTNAFVAAHEIGHILGGQHTTRGIMSAILTPSTQFTFSSVSAQQFANYIDNDSTASCITPGNVQAPSPSPSPTGEVSPPGTCGAAFSRKKALKCTRKTLNRPVLVAESGRTIGRLTARLIVRSGNFLVELSVGSKQFFRDVRGRISTISGSLSATPFVLPPNINILGLTRDANAPPIPSGSSSCCGKSIFLSYEVTVCRAFSGGTECVTLADSFSPRIRCANSCRRQPSSAIFTPMSSTNECPTCEVNA